MPLVYMQNSECEAKGDKEKSGPFASVHHPHDLRRDMITTGCRMTCRRKLPEIVLTWKKEIWIRACPKKLYAGFTIWGPVID